MATPGFQVLVEAISRRLFTAKGSIIAASQAGTPVEQTVGADGTVLMAKSGNTAGLNWDALVVEFDNGNSGTALTIDWSKGGTQKVTMNGNCTFMFTNPVAGHYYTLILTQDGTGSRTATWPTAKWQGGSAFVLSTSAGYVDIVTFYYDGTNYWAQGAAHWA